MTVVFLPWNEINKYNYLVVDIMALRINQLTADYIELPKRQLRCDYDIIGIEN